MSCDATNQAIERFLEGESGPEALLASLTGDAHAATCARCKAEIESALRLSESLGGALLAAAPEGALDRAVAAVAAEAKKEAAERAAEAAKPKPLRPARGWRAFKVAAAFLVTASLVAAYLTPNLIEARKGSGPYPPKVVVDNSSFMSNDFLALALPSDEEVVVLSTGVHPSENPVKAILRSQGASTGASSTPPTHRRLSDAEVAAEFARIQKEAGERLIDIQRRAEDSQRQLLEDMQLQQEAYSKSLTQQDARNAALVARLQRDLIHASNYDRAKMQAELDKLDKQPNSEAARKIIMENETSVFLIRAESYVQEKGARDRTPICRVEATGFAIAGDMIATAKHVVQPWKYDAKTLAIAKKLKEERGVDVQDHVEIYAKGAKGWEQRYDSASGSAKILKLMPDALEATTQTVEIEWNEQVTAVPGIATHKKNIDDLALIQVPGASLKAVKLGDGSAEKFDNVIILGTVRNADNKLISVSPARAEVQTKSDEAFSVNATVPTSFAGCPVFKYDGSVWGIVAGPEGPNLICHPISMVKKLHGGGKGGSGGQADAGGAGRDDPPLLPEEALGRLGCGTLFARAAEGVKGAGAALSLESISVDAEVAGTLATTLLRQRFANPYDRKIEAVYAFPLPHDAAVNEFVMEVGGRRIRGIVRERKEARRVYEAARRAGRTVSLLEQARPNVFHIAVANIEPAKAVEVTIRYFQALAPVDGALEYVLPLTVGERYGDAARAVASGSAPDLAGEHAVERALASTNASEARRGGVESEVTLSIDAGVPIASLVCPSHDAAMERVGPFRARVHLPLAARPLDRDLVVRIRLGAGREPTFGIVTHAGPHGRFAQVVVAPPAAREDEDHVSREVMFVLDSSGSMNGAPIEQSKYFIRKAIESLRARDTFNIATFAGRAFLLSERFLTPSPASVHAARRLLDTLSGAGGTEAEAGIRLALEAPGDPGRVRIVVFVTDGQVSFEGDILRRIQAGEGMARVFAIGVGDAPNRGLLDGMAQAGRGIATYIAPDATEKDLESEATALRSRLEAPVLCDVRLEAEGIAFADMLPSQPQDLVLGRTLSVAARVVRSGEGTIVVKARVGRTSVERRIAVTIPHDEPAHAALAPIWARAAIAEREAAIPAASVDVRAALEDEIKKIALDFHLASRATSFVAEDEGE